MITSKQRAYLRAKANGLSPVFQIGKEGVTENVLKQLALVLEKRELIKITVLNNSEDDAKGISEELAKKLRAEIVCTIGHKIVLYRFSHKDGVKHVEY